MFTDFYVDHHQFIPDDRLILPCQLDIIAFTLATADLEEACIGLLVSHSNWQLPRSDPLDTAQ